MMDHLCESAVKICHSVGDRIQHGCLGGGQCAVGCPLPCLCCNVGRKRGKCSFACCHSSHKGHLGLHHTAPMSVTHSLQSCGSFGPACRWYESFLWCTDIQRGSSTLPCKDFIPGTRFWRVGAHVAYASMAEFHNFFSLSAVDGEDNRNLLTAVQHLLGLHKQHQELRQSTMHSEGYTWYVNQILRSDLNDLG